MTGRMSGVIAIGSDHAGFHMKETLKGFLNQRDIPFEDYGCLSADSCDYPDIGYRVADAIHQQKFEFGILICGSGIGMAMAANRFSKVRAVVCYDTHTAELSRRHNNANVLCLGARVTAVEYAQSIIDVFLTVGFDEGRHTGRVDKLCNVPGVPC